MPVVEFKILDVFEDGSGDGKISKDRSSYQWDSKIYII